MDPVDAIGWMAAGLTLGTAMMRTMIPLRLLAIASNVAYLAYGALVISYPSMVLHVVLLPLNVYRLVQMRRLIQDVKHASTSGLSADWLAPFATTSELKAGDILFRKGDKADHLYYLASGRIRFVEIDVEIPSGTLFGEVAFFIPEGDRTQTAQCATECRLLSITESQLKQLYFQNPRFGWYLVSLIAQRLSQNVKRLQERSESPQLAGSEPMR